MTPNPTFRSMPAGITLHAGLRAVHRCRDGGNFIHKLLISNHLHCCTCPHSHTREARDMGNGKAEGLGSPKYMCEPCKGAMFLFCGQRLLLTASNIPPLQGSNVCVDLSQAFGLAQVCIHESVEMTPGIFQELISIKFFKNIRHYIFLFDLPFVIPAGFRRYI
jgi:hypothetical protein